MPAAGSLGCRAVSPAAHVDRCRCADRSCGFLARESPYALVRALRVRERQRVPVAGAEQRKRCFSISLRGNAQFPAPRGGGTYTLPRSASGRSDSTRSIRFRCRICRGLGSSDLQCGSWSSSRRQPCTFPRIFCHSARPRRPRPARRMFRSYTRQWDTDAASAPILTLEGFSIATPTSASARCFVSWRQAVKRPMHARKPIVGSYRLGSHASDSPLFSPRVNMMRPASSLGEAA